MYVANLKPGDVVGAHVKHDAPSRPFQEIANALTVERLHETKREDGVLLGVRIEWRGLGPALMSAFYPTASKCVVIES